MAAYLLARERTGRPVQPASKALLLRANETKKEVLAIMRFGRANVEHDLRANDHAGFHRLLALRQTVKSCSSLGEDPKITAARDAALSAHAGSGHCSEFANVAAHVHAGRLLGGERVQVKASERHDHPWIEVQGAEPHTGARVSAVIDAWAEGPVVEPVDSWYAEASTRDEGAAIEGLMAPDRGAGDGAAPEAAGNIDGADAADAHRRFQALRLDPGAALVRRFELQRGAYADADADKRPTGRVYPEPVPFVSSELCLAARAAIEGQRDQSPLRHRAAEWALEVVPHLCHAQAASAVDTILTFAANLDAPCPRPPAAAPTGSQARQA